MKRLIVVYFVLLTMVLSAQIQWQENGIPIRSGDYVRWYKCAVPIDSDVIYFWSDARRGDEDLWAQRLDEYGNKVWSEDLLICGEIDRQEAVDCLVNDDKTVIILWNDLRNQVFNGDIYAQKIDEDGDILWQENGVSVCSDSSYPEDINVITDGLGGFLSFWKYQNHSFKRRNCSRLGRKWQFDL